MKITSRLRDAAMEILQTAFRLFPWPTEAGLRTIGNPDASSPVLLTGNYDLTVRRLIRALDARFELGDAHRALACSACHEAWASDNGIEVVKYKPLGTQCTDCHGAHNAPYEDQLIAPATSLCLLCHDPEDDLFAGLR